MLHDLLCVIEPKPHHVLEHDKDIPGIMELGLLFLRSSAQRPAPLVPFLRSRKTLHLRVPLRLKISEGKPSKQELRGASSLHFSSCWDMSAIGLYTDGETDLQRQEGLSEVTSLVSAHFLFGVCPQPRNLLFPVTFFYPNTASEPLYSWFPAKAWSLPFFT